MVTHSMEQAQRIADTVVFLYLGKLVEKSSVEAFFEDPDDERTERFVAGETIADTQ